MEREQVSQWRKAYFNQIFIEDSKRDTRISPEEMEMVSNIAATWIIPLLSLRTNKEESCH